jgi:glycerophosphoryl diester phosphodiesterase
VEAIRELSYYTELPLQRFFLRWLMDSDQRVSHEAALALVAGRPHPAIGLFGMALHYHSAAARSNAAWAIGVLAHSAPDSRQCAPLLSPLLHDANSEVIKEALVGLSRCDRDSAHVPVNALRQLLTGSEPVQRGLAAVELARHHPAIAEREVPAQLEKEQKAFDSFNTAWTARGRPKLSQVEIDRTVELYRAQIKDLQALTLLPGRAARHTLAAQAFRSDQDYAMTPILVAGFDMWDRLAEDPAPALNALGSRNTGEADSAEWALVKAGPQVLPSIRRALPMSKGDLRRRLVEILAWQADEDGLPVLRSEEMSDKSSKDLIAWAISNINALNP